MYFSTNTIDRGCLSFSLHITKPLSCAVRHSIGYRALVVVSSFSSRIDDRFASSPANDLEIFSRTHKLFLLRLSLFLMSLTYVLKRRPVIVTFVAVLFLWFPGTTRFLLTTRISAYSYFGSAQLANQIMRQSQQTHL